MDTVYLQYRTEASELSDQQVFALMSWLNAVGILIVSASSRWAMSTALALVAAVLALPEDLTDLKNGFESPSAVWNREWLRRECDSVAETDDTTAKRKDKRPRFFQSSRAVTTSNPYSADVVGRS